MLRSALVLFLAVLMTVSTVAADESAKRPKTPIYNPYAPVLAEHGIRPTLEGVTGYLKELMPSVETQRRRKARLAKLIAQLGDSQYSVREQASRELRKSTVVPREALLKATRSADPEVRRRAAKILSLFGQRLKNRDSLSVAVCRTIQLRKIKGATSELLAAMPRFTQQYVLNAAADALAVTAQRQDVSLLRTAIRSGPDGVRVAAVRALGTVLGREATPELRQLFGGKTPAVQLAAARALADMGERDSLPMLGQLLSHQDLDVRIGSVAALRALTGKRFGYLAYRGSAGRLEATTRWRVWIEKNRKTAKLRFPLKHSQVEIGHTLVLLYKESKLVELDRGGRRIREIAGLNFPWAVKKLANGNILIGSYRGKFAAEYDAAGKQVWRKDKLPNGVFGIQRLANGNTLMACHSRGTVIEVNPAGAVVWQVNLKGVAFDAQRLENGNTLVALGSGKLVVEVDRKGKTVWKIEGLIYPRTAQRLKNGNTLVTDYRANRVAEYDRNAKLVWSHTRVSGPYSAQRLSGGRTMFSDRNGIHIVDHSGKILWGKKISGVGRALRF